jgi:hypothetical protein
MRRDLDIDQIAKLITEDPDILNEDQGALYYTVYPSTEDHLRVLIPTWPESIRIFASDNESVEAMSGWLNDFVRYGQMLKDGTCSMYQFRGPRPTQLPLNLSLNYVDIQNAVNLSEEDYEHSIKWLQQFDSETFINQQYAPGGLASKVQERFGSDKSRNNTTGREMVKVLSDVVKTTGPLVWNPKDDHPEMRYQIIATIPFDIYRINYESIMNAGYRSSLEDSGADIERLEDDIY